MGEGIAFPFPTYEVLLLTEAIRALATDGGVVTSPSAIGTNVLNDATKNWAPNVHKNRLVKIISGAGAGQLMVVGSNAAKALVIKQSWVQALDTTSVYQILDADIVSEFTDLKDKGLGFGGVVYENEDAAASDAARRFETASKKLRDIVIQVETNDQLFGNAANQRFKVTAGSSLGFTQVDLSTLYFKNATAGQNGTVRIIGVGE